MKLLSVIWFFGLFVAGVATTIWYQAELLKWEQKDENNKTSIYKQGWADGWQNHMEYDGCLLSDKAALMGAGGGKMLGCVSKDEAVGTTHDVLIDELP